MTRKISNSTEGSALGKTKSHWVKGFPESKGVDQYSMSINGGVLKMGDNFSQIFQYIKVGLAPIYQSSTRPPAPNRGALGVTFIREGEAHARVRARGPNC